MPSRSLMLALCAVLLTNVANALADSGSACPAATEAETATACTNNPNPDPIPRGFGGNRMRAEKCTATLIEALASKSSYDDSDCRSTVGDAQKLSLVSDAIAYLAVGEQKRAEKNDFHAELYCYRPENTLILSYRGSIEPTRISQKRG